MEPELGPAFCVDGVDYQHALPICAACGRGRKCSWAHPIFPADAARQRLRQSVLDIGYRAYCALEWLQDEDAERNDVGRLEDLHTVHMGCWTGQQTHLMRRWLSKCWMRP